MIDNKSFPCTKCGICCNSVGIWVMKARVILNTTTESGTALKTLREAASFPFEFDKTNGRCSQLSRNGNCKVYDTRPLICNIEKTWEKYYSETIAKGEYFKRTADVCNNLMDEGKIHVKFRVNSSEIS